MTRQKFAFSKPISDDQRVVIRKAPLLLNLYQQILNKSLFPPLLEALASLNHTHICNNAVNSSVEFNYDMTPTEIIHFRRPGKDKFRTFSRFQEINGGLYYTTTAIIRLQGQAQYSWEGGNSGISIFL